ncbi:MAG TPA: hypothetical protein VMT24_17470 [Aggregatilineaceae bacterium]|nr:hypothetical protein [Aggregatilineaceae bacterium]
MRVAALRVVTGACAIYGNGGGGEAQAHRARGAHRRLEGALLADSPGTPVCGPISPYPPSPLSPAELEKGGAASLFSPVCEAGRGQGTGKP